MSMKTFIKNKINRFACWCLGFIAKDTDDVRQYKHLRKLRFHSKTPLRKQILLVDYSDVTFGLADRFIGILSLYMLAKETNRQIKIHHTCDFVLQDYLIPNKTDWLIKEEEIAHGINECRLLIARLGQKKLKHSGLPKLSNEILQYHAYSNHDFRNYLQTDQLNKYDRHILFHELFKPSVYLEKLIQSIKADFLERPYLAVHLRFMNFFEQVERNTINGHIRDETQQQCMISLCRKQLDKIHHQFPNDIILLFTDSHFFSSLQFPSYIKSIPGKIGHISANHKDKSDIIDKTFIDLFIMSKATRVINIIGKNLRKSGFSKIAAEIGGISYMTMSIDDSNII